MFPDKVWRVMQESVYEKNIQDLDELRERIVEEWEWLDQSVSTLPSDSDAVD